MRSTICGVLAGVAALAVSACATMSVSSHVEPTVDLRLFYTYDWGPRDALPVLQTGTDLTRLRRYAWAEQRPYSTGDPRLDANPFFDTATRAAIDRALAGRGLAHVAEAPDVVFHYHVSMRQKLDLSGADSSYLTCEECTPTVYEAGTLVIDAVDPRSDRLLWRGWAEGSFDGFIDQQTALTTRIDEAVTRVLARYPAMPAS